MSHQYVPEPDGNTVCLVCKCTPRRGSDGKPEPWRMVTPEATPPRKIFAGYFCGETCKESWQEMDDHGRMVLIWGTKQNNGSPEAGYELLRRIARGEIAPCSEDEPQEIPEFGPRLPAHEARIEISMRGRWGRLVTLFHSAPFVRTGWRKPVKGGVGMKRW